MSSAKWRPFCLGLNESSDGVGVLGMHRQIVHLGHNRRGYWLFIVVFKAQVKDASICSLNRPPFRMEYRHLSEMRVPQKVALKLWYLNISIINLYFWYIHVVT